MTDDKKRIEEIRNKQKDGDDYATECTYYMRHRTAFKDVQFLLAQIDKRDEALRVMLKEFRSADLVWTQRKAVSDAREALGEE